MINTKLLLLSFLTLFSFYAEAQKKFPLYENVLKRFLTLYEMKVDYDDYTQFEKRKNGWYVSQIDRLNGDNVLSSQLFWNAETGQFIKAIQNYNTANKNPSEIENEIAELLAQDWYNYNHSAYYGYNGYADDIIHDFSDKINLTNEERESLARAYSSKAMHYLYYQQGGRNITGDSMQNGLRPGQIPSEERIKKSLSNLDKSIELYKEIAAQNPGYQTLVGNVTLKLFNEKMNAYSQLNLTGYDKYMSKYLDDIKLDVRSINQAKNYLNSCPKNAILFTYGDNDTYQLWYVQTKLGHRTDVAVINNTLLGLTSYLLMLRRNGIVEFSAPDDFLLDSTATFAISSPIENPDREDAVSLRTTLDSIFYNPVDVSVEKKYRIFPSQKIKLELTENNIIATEARTLYLNDIMMLDIIQSNFSKRKLCFTSPPSPLLDKYVFPKGIVYEMETTDSSRLDDYNATVYNQLLSFKKNEFVPVVSDWSSPDSFTCSDGDNSLTFIYYNLVTYYLQANDIVTSKKLIEEFIQLNKGFSKYNLYSINYLAYFLLWTDQASRAIPYIEKYAEYKKGNLDHPDPLCGFMKKENTIDELEMLKSELKKKKLNSKKLEDIITYIKKAK